MALSDEKAQLRAAVRQHMTSMSSVARARESAAVVHHLRQHLPQSGLVFAYMALPDEVDLMALLVDLAAAGRLCLPCVRVDGLSWHLVTDLEHDLAPGRYSIQEPVTPALVVGPSPCWILVPGRAFDRQGSRLGRGGGYYDRAALAYPSAQRVGIAFAAQLLTKVPCEPHDVRMHALVSEQGWLDV